MNNEHGMTEIPAWKLRVGDRWAILPGLGGPVQIVGHRWTEETQDFWHWPAQIKVWVTDQSGSNKTDFGLNETIWIEDRESPVVDARARRVAEITPHSDKCLAVGFGNFCICWKRLVRL